MKRWLENLISPLSKVALTVVLSLFAFLVLIASAQTKDRLMDRLKKTEAYSIYLSENVLKEDVFTRAQTALDEESMWMSMFRADRVTYLMQPFMTAKSPHGGYIPIIIFNESLPELHVYKDDHPSAWILSDEFYGTESEVEVIIQEKSLSALNAKLPSFIASRLGVKEVLAIPLEMSASLLLNGYTSHLISRLESTEEVELFSRLASSYYRAEKREIRTFSTLSLLREIQQLNDAQEKIRYGILLACGSILALVLGAISWLEFRQESYLLALLKSFGVSSSVLFLHAFFENFLLVFIAVAFSFVVWEDVYQLLLRRVSFLSTNYQNELSIPIEDSVTIIVFATAGVVLAVVPIAIGLKKEPGLILR